MCPRGLHLWLTALPEPPMQDVNVLQKKIKERNADRATSQTRFTVMLQTLLILQNSVYKL